MREYMSEYLDNLKPYEILNITLNKCKSLHYQKICSFL